LAQSDNDPQGAKQDAQRKSSYHSTLTFALHPKRERK